MAIRVVVLCAVILGILIDRHTLQSSRHEAGIMVDGRKIQFPHWAQVEMIHALAPAELAFVTSIAYRKQHGFSVTEDEDRQAQEILSRSAKRWMDAHPDGVEATMKELPFLEQQRLQDRC